MDSETLSRLAGVPRTTLRQWVHKGAIPRPERGNDWSLVEALCVLVLCTAVRAGRTLAAAREEVCWKVPLLGDLVRGMVQDGRHGAADLVIFIRCEFASAQPWRRVVTSTDDRMRLVEAALRRGAVRLELDDFTEPYCDVLAAFQRTRAKEYA